MNKRQNIFHRGSNSPLGVGGFLVFLLLTFSSCKKNSSSDTQPAPTTESFDFSNVKINGNVTSLNVNDVNYLPAIKFSFSSKVDHNSVTSGISFKNKAGGIVNFNSSYENSDSSLIIQPMNSLTPITKYTVTLNAALHSQKGKALVPDVSLSFITSIDSTDKFPQLSDNALLDLIQQQTFKYFWDFGHPVSGMARERNSSGDVCTTGGTGFGIMALPVAVSRNFITRANAVVRLQTIVSFLKNTVPKFHGAFSHWVNGGTGAVIPFSANDDGADLVETSYLMMGLLTARQYFNGADPTETALRNDINTLYNGVEWDWFRRDNRKVLYWHWSSTQAWVMNVPVQGWNECLITYIMGAASTTHNIPKAVYDSGFARNGAEKNGNTYLGYTLPLGPAYGGPLFFSHYTFLGVNPNSLNDVYANYQTQTVNHTKINYEYCKANPQNNFGYSNACWGLTASDIPTGYSASSPTNDLGVIAPTAAISSLPYTPTESMAALKFFYYKLGDKLWKQYGFIDAFSLKDQWYADSFLAIDQGPEIVMIENYRTGLLWNLFTSCQEVKAGMLSLGFTASYL
ncbi:MAG: glucoamylase family protein [Ferruginibacter sp.]